MNPEHLSLYLLEIHEGTPLAEQIRSNRQPLPDEDLAGEMYEMMIQKVSDKGFEQYELSSFSKPEFQSKHNNKYWLLEPVFGFGVSAHSFDGINRRWSNERDTNQYVELVENKQTPVVETLELSEKQLSAEFAFLSLRLKKGLDLSEYKLRFGVDLTVKFAEDFERFEELGLIELNENTLRLTPKGFVFSNEVFSLFV
jgi:oxygen-independent coproporphyrinogen-3 oxidase